MVASVRGRQYPPGIYRVSNLITPVHLDLTVFDQEGRIMSKAVSIKNSLSQVSYTSRSYYVESEFYLLVWVCNVFYNGFVRIILAISMFFRCAILLDTRVSSGLYCILVTYLHNLPFIV